MGISRAYIQGRLPYAGGTSDNERLIGSYACLAADMDTKSLRLLDGETTGGFPLGFGVVDVRQFGAAVDAANSLPEVQAAVDYAGRSGGGYVLFPPGVFNLTDRLLIPWDDVMLALSPATTLMLSGWLYNGTQVPFGNQIDITGRRSGVIGGGPSSLIQLTGGSQANAIGFRHRSKGIISNLTIDGDKDNSTAISDDTFQSGVSVLNDTTQNPEGDDGEFLVSNLWIRNCVQYGMNLYGNLVNYSNFDNISCYDNGNADALSVGGGVAITFGCSDLRLNNVNTWGCKADGVFISSAGKQMNRVSFSNLSAVDNGRNGVAVIEELNAGSVVNIGQNGIMINGGQFSGNTLCGVRVTTSDNVGVIKNVSVAGAVIQDNGDFGLLVTSPDITVTRLAINGIMCSDNTNVGIALGGFVRETNVKGSVALGNAAPQILDVSGLNDITGNIV